MTTPGPANGAPSATPSASRFSPKTWLQGPKWRWPAGSRVRFFPPPWPVSRPSPATWWPTRRGFCGSSDRAGKCETYRSPKLPFEYLSLPHIDFLKVLRNEARHFDVAQVRRQTTLIVTEGADGCVLYTRDSELRIPAFPADEVDSTGAGDCFFAGFAYGLVRGLGVERALRLGNRCGSLAVGQIGVPRIGTAAAGGHRACARSGLKLQRRAEIELRQLIVIRLHVK